MNGFYNLPCRGSMFRQPNQAGQAPSGAGGAMPLYPLPIVPAGGYTTGAPTGPAYAPPVIPTPPAAPQVPQVPAAAAPEVAILPQTWLSTLYTAGFLKTQIGKKVRVDFLIGTNIVTDRTGTLVGVGASYILLRIEETGEIIMGDLYSIKFVTVMPPTAREDENQTE